MKAKLNSSEKYSDLCWHVLVTNLRYSEESQQIRDLYGRHRAGSSDHPAYDLPHMAFAAATLIAVDVADRPCGWKKAEERINFCVRADIIFKTEVMLLITGAAPVCDENLSSET